MTEEWKKIIIRYHYIVVCILMGLLVLGGVFVGSIQTDLNTAEKHFSDTISYIKEQCTGYDNLNLASETKSLMRVMENVQHLCSDIERERELDDSFVLDDAAVAQYLRSYTITGALLLTPEGKVECSASTDGLTDDPLTADELPQTLSRGGSSWRTAPMWISRPVPARTNAACWWCITTPRKNMRATTTFLIRTSCRDIHRRRTAPLW